MAEGVTIKITGEDELQLMFDWFIERFRSGKVPIGEVCEYAKCALAVYDIEAQGRSFAVYQGYSNMRACERA